jgi:hypothetical protein
MERLKQHAAIGDDGRSASRFSRSCGSLDSAASNTPQQQWPRRLLLLLFIPATFETLHPELIVRLRNVLQKELR